MQPGLWDNVSADNSTHFLWRRLSSLGCTVAGVPCQRFTNPVCTLQLDGTQNNLPELSSWIPKWFQRHAGTRLYRETPGSLLKGKGKKQSEPQWELLAATPEDLTELGERLRRSKKKPDQNLASLVGRQTLSKPWPH